MGKNGILKNKAGEQIFPATTADQVAWNDRMNLKQAISEKLGAPYAASTVSSMTDKTRIYVYTGSESGYTKGNWYYWNGSSWVSGGVYNSVAVETDKTLTVADKAADSAIVGQQIGELNESIEQLKQGGETGSGTGFSAEAINKLEEVGNYLTYTTADGGSKWKELISILRSGSGGSGSGGSGSGGSGSGGSVTTEVPKDGLLSYFDLRNSEPTVDTSKGKTSYLATVGSGCFFTWSATSHTTSDKYGTKMARSILYDKYGGTTTSSCGTAFTWCFIGYNGLMASRSYIALSNITAFCVNPTYNTSSSTTRLGATDVSGSSKSGYTTVFVVVDGDNLKIYVNGELYKEYNGADYSDFKSWYSKLEVGAIVTNADNYFTAMAIYNKALSAVELTEVQAYFETLEVA